MIISNEHIITLQKLKGFGPRKIEQVAFAISSSQFNSLNLGDLYDILIDLKDAGKLKGIKELPDFEELEDANYKARFIIKKSTELGINMVSRFDSVFPKNLHKTLKEDGKLDIPLLLYYKGDLSITQKPAIAIIGTREPSSHGIIAGEKFGEYFASNGLNIVSGLALGCDSAGHRGALKAPNGVTTAFLAHGLDMVYPAENESLAEEIVAKGGLLMSEYPIGEHVNRNYLVNRDRLQAALADTTLVIQTNVTGGTMHAVNATIAAGKPLCAVEYKVPIPGWKDAGNRKLISENKAIPLRSDNQEEILHKLILDPFRGNRTDKYQVNKGDGPCDTSFEEGTLFNN